MLVLILTALLSQMPQNQNQRLEGFQQQGQLTSDAAIVRDPNSFVGANSQNFLDTSQNSQNSQINQIPQNTGLNSRGRSNTTKSNITNPTGGIRYRIKSVKTQISTTSYIDTKIPIRLKRIPGLTDVKVVVAVCNHTATVTGTVANDREKELVNRLILLEPGISRVCDQISVQ